MGLSSKNLKPFFTLLRQKRLMKCKKATLKLKLAHAFFAEFAQKVALAIASRLTKRLAAGKSTHICAFSVQLA